MLGVGVPGSQQKLWAGFQLRNLREKYLECGGGLTEAQEDVKPLHLQGPGSTGSVSHRTYTEPLVRTPCPQPFYLCPLCLSPTG